MPPKKDKKTAAQPTQKPAAANTVAQNEAPARMRVMMVSDTPNYTLTANELRRLAEHADGCRGGLMEITGEKPGGSIRRIGSSMQAKPGAIIVQTPFKNPARPLPLRVEVVRQAGAPSTLDPNHFDSVFWGEAAMEKFLVPYYIRFSDDDVEKIREAIRSQDVIALAHVYPTFYELFKDTVFVLSDDPTFSDSGFIPLTDWLSRR